MRARLTGCLLFALVLGGAGTARAQTADDVVNKILTALGGREALSKLTSRTTTGKITVSTPGGDVKGTVDVQNKAPNNVRTLISLDLSSLGAGMMTVDQRFDGTSGIVLDSMQGNRDLTGDQLANMKNQEFPTPLLHYKEHGTKIELGEKEKVGDRDAQVLTVTPKEGPSSRLYVDTQTWLPMRVVQTLELPEVGRVEQTTELSDYRDVDGIMVPFSINNSSSVQKISIAVDKIQHNVDVDSTLFKKPGGGL